MAKENNYNDLVSLKGPDQVRLRPGVIFGSDSVDGCRHSVFEIISNSIDEAREGYGKRVRRVLTQLFRKLRHMIDEVLYLLIEAIDLR